MKFEECFPPAWHEDQTKREAMGIMTEAKFQLKWKCKCGGNFERWYVGKAKGSPDFQCEKCGQFAEVKGNTKSYKRDSISISRIPFENYPSETIIAYCDHDETWFGVYRKDCIVESGPHPPKHQTRGTEFYMISLENFTPLMEYFEEK